jgi:site-specific recombinase XerD
LADAAKEFLKEMETLDRKKNSVAVYASTLCDFQSACRREFIEDLTRKDILNFIAWMREGNMKVRVPGSQNRTYQNKLAYLSSLLNRRGVQLMNQRNAQSSTDHGLLYRSDVPKVVRKKPKKRQSTIDVLFEKADVAERDYLEFLLWSGFRDEEA